MIMDLLWGMAPNYSRVAEQPDQIFLLGIHTDKGNASGVAVLAQQVSEGLHLCYPGIIKRLTLSDRCALLPRPRVLSDGYGLFAVHSSKRVPDLLLRTLVHPRRGWATEGRQAADLFAVEGTGFASAHR